MDDKPILDFLEKIPSFIRVNTTKAFQNYFFNFLFDIVNKEITDKYNETLIKKFIVMAENIVKEKEFESVVSFEILEQFLEKLKNIILLKFENDYNSLYFNVWKGNNPIWLFASEELMKVTPVLMENFKINQVVADIFRTILTAKKDKKSLFFSRYSFDKRDNLRQFKRGSPHRLS